MATVDPSEVDRLADELFIQSTVNVYNSTAFVHREELRALARAAAAVGVRTALEGAPHGSGCPLSPDTYWREFWGDRVCDCWKSRADTYTPEQEDDNR